MKRTIDQVIVVDDEQPLNRQKTVITSLDITGSSDIKLTKNGIKADTAILTELKDGKLTVKTKPESNMWDMVNNVIANSGSIVGAAIGHNARNVVSSSFNGCTFSGNSVAINNGVIIKRRSNKKQDNDDEQEWKLPADCRFELESISVGGSGTLQIVDPTLLDKQHLKLSAVGSGDIKIKTYYDIKQVVASVHGSADIKGELTAKTATLTASGSGSIKGFTVIDRVTAHASGSSEIIVHVLPETETGKCKSGSATVKFKINKK